jgi:FkbM family methyltransferase
LNFENYKCYGFEASKQFADINEDMYRRNDDVTIIQKAISDTHNGTTKLYYMNPEIQPGQVGMSIFESKIDASEDYEEVETIKFSEWLTENVPTYQEDFNILKVNIEGAEYHLFKDMVDNDILKYFPTIIGAGHDVEKVSELDSNEYWKLIKDNNINLKRYCSNHKPERNVDIIPLIFFDHQSYLTKTSP